MKARIYVTLRNGVLDPQGKAIENTLGHMGFDNIGNVRQGKYIELELNTKDKESAEKTLDEMCRNLLANTVIENYRYEVA